MRLITFFPDDGRRGPIVVNQDRIDGITEEWGKAIIHAGSLEFRVRESQREVCEMLMENEDLVRVTRCKNCKKKEICDDIRPAWKDEKPDWFCADGIPKDGASE